VFGSLTLAAAGGEQVACRSEAGVFRPRSDDSEAVLLPRLIPRASATARFVALAQRIDQLSHEIFVRKQGEEKLRATEGGERTLRP
jgi:hypothetical protein